MSQTLWTNLIVSCCFLTLAAGEAMAQRQQDREGQRQQYQDDQRFDQDDQRFDADQRTPNNERLQDDQRYREDQGSDRDYGDDRSTDDQRTLDGREQPAGLGVSISEGGQQGVRVEIVHEGSPAAEAGLREGDQILQVSGQPIDSVQDLISTIRRMSPGRTVNILIMRDGRQRTLTASLESRQAALNRQQQMRFYRLPATPWSDEDVSVHINSLEQEIRRLAEEIRDLKAMLNGNPEDGDGTATGIGQRQRRLLDRFPRRTNDAQDRTRPLRESVEQNRETDQQ